jgi:uncharacterized protein (TIGR02271 family)
MLSWRGRDLCDREDGKVGKIGDIWVDTETGRPEWALVNTGLFGTKSTFVPLSDAGEAGDKVRVPYDKDQIKNAPRIDADQQLSQREEAELYRHYGLEYSELRSDSGLPEGGAGEPRGTDTEGETSAARARGTTAADGDRGEAGTSRADDEAPSGTVADRGPATGAAGARGDEATGRRGEGGDAPGRRGGTEGGESTGADATDDAMTRSEDELRVGTADRETGRVRLRKHVVTEDVRETVPVEREEARVEREPISDANVEQAMRGPEITEAEHEVVLHEEEPVVEKRTVPKERVRLEKDTVGEEREVSETVRKEQVEVDDSRRGEG